MNEPVIAGEDPSPPMAMTDFVAGHGLGLTRFAYLISGDRDRAEDLVQDALLGMHRRFGEVLALTDPLAYARRAIVNANVSWSRRRWRHELPVEQLPTIGVEDPDQIVNDELWRTLRVLPLRQRAVLVLRYYSGYSDQEIAELIGARPATVRSLAARGLAKLRRRLTGSGAFGKDTR